MEVALEEESEMCDVNYEVAPSIHERLGRIFSSLTCSRVFSNCFLNSSLAAACFCCGVWCSIFGFTGVEASDERRSEDFVLLLIKWAKLGGKDDGMNLGSCEKGRSA